MPDDPFEFQSWDELDRWLAPHGDSAWLVSLARFASNCNEFLSPLRHHYARSRIGYSYKTNYTPAICRVADSVGCYAEVVSGMELQLALRLGIPGRRILFNGPVKSDSELGLAVEHDVQINIDNSDEWNRLQPLLPSEGSPARIAVRASFPLVWDHVSRFGVDAASDELHLLAQQIRRHPGASLVGLHCHFSHHRDAASYRKRTQTLLELVDKLFPDQAPEYIDVGGGFSGKIPAELAAQFPVPPASWQDYGEAIGIPMRDRFGNSGPELVVEPGIGIVADCVVFATRVVATKWIRGQRFAITDGSIHNVKMPQNPYDLSVSVISRNASGETRQASLPTVISGSTCMEVDILHRGMTQEVDTGDILVFSNVGAYTNVLTPPFIRPAPAILCIDDPEPEVLRRAQTMDDVFSTYTF